MQDEAVLPVATVCPSTNNPLTVMYVSEMNFFKLKLTGVNG